MAISPSETDDGLALDDHRLPAGGGRSEHRRSDRGRSAAARATPHAHGLDQLPAGQVVHELLRCPHQTRSDSDLERAHQQGARESLTDVGSTSAIQRSRPEPFNVK